MKWTIVTTLALLVWLWTLLLLIPAFVSPPQAWSLVCVVLIDGLPYSQLSNPDVYTILHVSYWIGVVLTVLASIWVIYASGKSKRVAWLIGGVDLLAILASFLLGYIESMRMLAR